MFGNDPLLLLDQMFESDSQILELDTSLVCHGLQILGDSLLFHDLLRKHYAPCNFLHEIFDCVLSPFHMGRLCDCFGFGA